MKKHSLLIFLCYLIVYFVWGSTYLFIKMAVATIPPFYFVGLRFLLGGAGLLVFVLISGRLYRMPSSKEMMAACFSGTLLLIGGNGLVTIAERSVDSYLAALIISTTPVVVAFFDRVLLGKRISALKVISILVGITGVGILLYNGQSLFRSFSPGVLLILGGLICWAFATSVGHKLNVFPDVFVTSSIQMVFVGLVCVGVAFLQRPPSMQLLSQFSLQSLISLAYLAVFGSLAFCAFNFLIQNEPAVRVVSYALVNPLIATFLGLYVAKEAPMPFLVPGIVLILIGLFCMLYGDEILSRIRKSETAQNSDQRVERSAEMVK